MRAKKPGGQLLQQIEGYAGAYSGIAKRRDPSSPQAAGPDLDFTWRGQFFGILDLGLSDNDSRGHRHRFEGSSISPDLTPVCT